MPLPAASIESWSPQELPDAYRLQIIAYMRQVWPQGFRGDNRLRNWIHPLSDHPRHFVGLLPNGAVAGHASALWRDFFAYGEKWKVGGLSGVFTFEHLVREGWGTALITAAEQHLQTLSLDAALFCCQQELLPFYTRVGWQPLSGAVLTVGNPPEPETEAVLFRPYSSRAKTLLQKMETTPLHFGDYSW